MKTTDGTKSIAEAGTKILSNSMAADLVRSPEFLVDNDKHNSLATT